LVLAWGGSNLSERVMKTIRKIATASAVAFFRTCFHRDARIGRKCEEILRAPAPILPVIFSRRDGLQLHKLSAMRGDSLGPVC
jgi:hypothetical protein